VLGVPREADAAAIKNAFRALALRYHPDRNKEPGAEERFKEIAEAYAVLSDPKKRGEYDARGFAGVAGFAPEDLFGGIDFEDLLGGLGGIGWDRGGLFDRFVRRRRPGPPRGDNLEVALEIPLERVARGGEETVRVRRLDTCEACRGSGAMAGASPRQCGGCQGTGQRASTRRQANMTVQTITTCPDCRGRGRIIDQPCPACAGRGQAEREESLTVKIPVGIEDGTALRVPGRGLPAPGPGAQPGDLFVVVRTAPDPRFERAGADLWRIDTISVADAVLGTSLETPTLDGNVAVTVPPGTQPDAVLRVRGKGLPGPGTGRRGDLYLRLRVQVPTRVLAEERKLYERLRALAGTGGHDTGGRRRRAGPRRERGASDVAPDASGQTGGAP
jgi:molecular chaperone DnaJ